MCYRNSGKRSDCPIYIHVNYIHFFTFLSLFWLDILLVSSGSKITVSEHQHDTVSTLRS